MELNAIIFHILETLTAGGGRASLGELADALGISRRTLLYNLKKLNYALECVGAPPVSISEDTLRFEEPVPGDLLGQLQAHAQNAYVLSAEERKALILLGSGLMKQGVTVEWLCSFLNISKNTVLSDVSELKQSLAEPGIQLNSKGRFGYGLDGDELTIRYCIYEYLATLKTGFTQSKADEILLAAIRLRTGKDFDKDAVFTKIHDAVKQSEGLAFGKYNHDSLQELAYYFLLVLCRAGLGSLYMDDEAIRSSVEYRAMEHILQQLAATGLVIPMEEGAYLTAVLLGAKLYSFNEIAARSMVDLRAFANDLINTFEARACVRLTNRELRIDQFLVHLRPLYYRLKYQVKVQNLYVDEIRQAYRSIYEITLAAVRAVEGRYGLAVPEDEVAYIAVYLASWLKHPQGGQGTQRKILIVCSAGIGTSLLLRHQIAETIGMGYRFEVKDYRESSVSDTLNYDLIVATVQLPYRDAKILRANPILTTQQKEQLLQWSFSNPGRGEVFDRVKQVISVAEQFATINDRSMLAINLRRYFEGNGGQQRQPRLWDVLTLDLVQTTRKTVGDRQALDYACHPLIAAGLVDEAYAESVYAIISQMGLYAEIAPGVLLAHAHPSASVHGVGLALTVFRKPVPFEQWGKEIRVIVALCTPDNQAHSLVLKDFIRLLDAPGVREALLQRPFADADALYRYLRESDSGEENG